MQIDCTSDSVADQVMELLAKLGVSTISQQGPFLGDPTVMVMINEEISSEQESRIRREVNGIAGATVHEEA